MSASESPAPPTTEPATTATPAAAEAQPPQHAQNAALERFYRWNAKIYDATRWAILRFRRRAFAGLTIPEGARVLDVGCGTGLNFPYILKQQPKLGRLWALDLSGEMLKVAQKKMDRDPRLREIGLTIQANAESYTLPEFETIGRPDIISYAYSLSMIPNWEASLRCSYEHLAPGGTMMILDFGQLKWWPLVGPLFVWYLRQNHVKHFSAPWETVLRDDLGAAVEHHSVNGNYSVITYARKPAAD